MECGLDGFSLWCVLMYEAFFEFYSCNEDIKPSAAFSCRQIKYKIYPPECTKPRHFYFKNSKIFWGGGTALSLGPSPSGRGTPPPAPTPLGASIFAPSALSHVPPHSEVWPALSDPWGEILALTDPRGIDVLTGANPYSILTSHHVSGRPPLGGITTLALTQLHKS